MSRKRTAAIAAAVAAGTVVAGAAVGVLSGRRHRASDGAQTIGDLPPEVLDPIASFDGTADRDQGGGGSRRPGVAVHPRLQPRHVRLARAVDRPRR